MKELLRKLSLIFSPWVYSENGMVRHHRITNKKQTAVIEDDWCGMPKITDWKNN